MRHKDAQKLYELVSSYSLTTIMSEMVNIMDAIITESTAENFWLNNTKHRRDILAQAARDLT